MSHSIVEVFGTTDPIRAFWQGRVHRAPVDLSDKMDVIVPQFDEQLVWRDCMWQLRDHVTLPEVGDKVLLVLDDLAEPWVISWWPW